MLAALLALAYASAMWLLIERPMRHSSQGKADRTRGQRWQLRLRRRATFLPALRYSVDFVSRQLRFFAAIAARFAALTMLASIDA
jgi:hypothetical protein